MLDNIFASISEAAVNYNFPKAYKLVQHISHASIKALTHRLNYYLLVNASSRPLTITEVT